MKLPALILPVVAGMLLSACGSAAAPAASTSAAPPASASAATKPAGAAPASAPASAAATVSLKYGLSGTGGATTIFRLMNDENIWAQEGIKAEMQQFQGDPIAYTALGAGELDFVSAGADAAVALALKGSPIRIIGVVQNKFEYHLMGGKGVKTAADVKGKIAGVSKIGSNSDFATREVLKRMQIDPGSMTFLQVGNSVQRAAALDSGSVQVALMSPDFVPQLVDKGFTDLADMSKMDIAYPFLCIGVTMGLLNDKPDVAQRILRATYRGIKRFRDDPAAAQKILAAQSNETRKEVLQESWTTYSGVFATDLAPDPKVFTELLKELATTEPAAKDPKPEQYLDLRPAQQVNSSGFLKQI